MQGHAYCYQTSYSWNIFDIRAHVDKIIVEQKKSSQVRKKATSPNAASDEVAHVVVRVRSEEGQTVSAHRKVIERNERAFFAKIGKGLGPAFIEQLNGQINRGIPTYLFLATYEGWNAPFGLYQSELLGVHAKLEEHQTKLVPVYLQSAIKNVSTWFEIRTLYRVAREDINKIYILSSGREVSGSLRGTTAVFRVGVKGKAAMKEVSDPTLKTKKSSDSGSSEFEDYSEDGDDQAYISGLDWTQQD